MNSLRQRWEWIQEIVSKNKRDQDVKIVAVSKNCAIQAIQEARSLGVEHFAENYVQEAMPKITKLQDPKIQWHFIGNVQTNKMNKIIPAVQWVHSISQKSQCAKLEKMRKEGIPIPHLLVQINIANEKTKSGLDETEIQSFMEFVSQETKLEIRGLMVFPPYQKDPESNRVYFAKTRQWKDTINSWKLDRVRIRDLSMGVSNDYAIAIQEGATLIRIGEGLFGVRTHG